MVGSTLLLVSGVRATRYESNAKIDEAIKLLSRTLMRTGPGGDGTGPSAQVVAGSSTYHQPGCRVLEGKSGLHVLSVEQAVAEKLAPCRVCDPPAPGDTAAGPAGRSDEGISAESEGRSR